MFSCIKFDVVSVLLSVSSIVVCQISFQYHSFDGNYACNAYPYSACQRISNCPSALEDIINGGRPNICSFDDNEPRVCCDMRRTTRLQQGNTEVITIISDPSENTYRPLQYNVPLRNPFGRKQSSTKHPSENPFGWSQNDVPLQNPFGQNSAQNPSEMPFGRLQGNTQRPTEDIIGRLESSRETGYTAEGPSSANSPEPRNKQSSEPATTTTTTEASLFTTTPPPPIPGIENSKCVQKCQEYGAICRRAVPAVFGGESAKPKQFPHMALIGFGPENDKSWQCGGSVISKRYILSAAHCTFAGEITGFAKWVRLGELDHSTSTDDAKHEDYTITERFNHPRYNPPLMYNDISLYKVDREIVFNDYIEPICLHTTFDISAREGKAAGWGRVEFVGPTSNHLLYANISFVQPERCKDSLQNKLSRSLFPDGLRTDSLVCAGEADGSKDTCQGDSGGPLFIHQEYPWPLCLYRQVGITSTGLPCSQENSPGLYTRVSSFIPWIESIAWANDP